MLYEYWKGHLSGNALQFYEEMMREFSRGKERVMLQGLSPEDCIKTYSYFQCDHPELFYLTHMGDLSSTFGGNWVFTSKSIYSAAEITKRKQRLAECVKQIERGLPMRASELEREAAVIDLLLDTVTYQINNTYNQDASSALYAGKAQCSGISQAVKYLCDQLSLKCICVTGQGNKDGKSFPHAWNIIYIGGVPYHLDVTYMVGANQKGARPYTYIDLNLSDKQAHTLYRWNDSLTPPCTQAFTVPQGAPSYIKERIHLMSEVYSVSENAIIVSSLYAFRKLFLEALEQPHNTMSFVSQIKCDNDGELMHIIAQACRQCFAQKGKSYSMNISISRNMVTLTW
jgi:hypothetical protein